MREILFRGKRVDNGEWIEGAFCPKSCDLPFGPMVDKPSIIKLDTPFSGFWFEVIAKTVGQYTGMTDKNGTKVFEGDIVQNDEVELYGAVVYAASQAGYEGVAGFLVDDISLGLQEYEFWHLTEVIGNVHDNPELLGGDDNGE